MCQRAGAADARTGRQVQRSTGHQPGAPHGHTAAGTRHHSITQRHHAIHQHDADPLRFRVRDLVRCAIRHGQRIEHGDVRRHARCDESAVDESDQGGRQPAHFSHGLLPSERACFAHIVPENSRKRAEAAWVCARVQPRPTVAGNHGIGILQNLEQVRLGAKRHDRRGRLGFENLDDGFTTCLRTLLAHDVSQSTPCFVQHDAFRTVESCRDRLIGFNHDARSQRAVGKAFAHFGEPAVLRPAWDNERGERRLSGEVGIHVCRHPSTAGRGGAHHVEHGGRRPLLTTLHLHVRKHRHQACAVADGHGLFHALAGTEAHLWREPIMVREKRAPRARWQQHLNHFRHRGEVRRLVVKPSRHAERAALQIRHHERAHLLDVGSCRARVGWSHHAGPDSIEADAGRDIDR